MNEEEYEDETDTKFKGYVNYVQVHGSGNSTGSSKTLEPVQAALPYVDILNYPKT